MPGALVGCPAPATESTLAQCAREASAGRGAQSMACSASACGVCARRVCLGAWFYAPSRLATLQPKKRAFGPFDSPTRAVLLRI